MSKQLNELNKNLTELNDKFRKREVFVRGIVRGVGFAIGTTIVAAIVFSILAWLLQPVLSDGQIQNLLGTN